MEALCGQLVDNYRYWCIYQVFNYMAKSKGPHTQTQRGIPLLRWHRTHNHWALKCTQRSGSRVYLLSRASSPETRAPPQVRAHCPRTLARRLHGCDLHGRTFATVAHHKKIPSTLGLNPSNFGESECRAHIMPSRSSISLAVNLRRARDETRRVSPLRWRSTSSGPRGSEQRLEQQATMANSLQPLLHGLDAFCGAHLSQCSEKLLVSRTRRLE